MVNIRRLSLASISTHQRVAWLLLAGLLVIRLPLLGGVMLFANPGWLVPVYEVGTYLLMACLIWWERERLADFHIDGLALWIILLFKPIQTLYLTLIWHFDSDPLAFPNWPGLCFWVIAGGLVLALWLSHTPWPKLTRRSFIWSGLGILVGLVLALMLALPMSIQVPDAPPFSGAVAWAALREGVPSFFYQMGYAAVSEEPLFRGFLWGYLRQAGWKNRWILLTQAGLFVLGHIFYINTAPISFWIIVPTGALVLGGLVWRSKSLSSSLAAHATVNGIGYTFGYIAASLIRGA
jgi:hypothetical protein